MKSTIFFVLAISTIAMIYPTDANDVENLLKQLQEAVDKAVAEGKAKVEEAKAKVNQAAQALESEAQSAMQHTEDEFKKELDALKEKAKQAGVNIDSCLGADEQKLVTLPTTGTNDMVNCVAGKINHVFDTAEQTLTKIQSVVDEVANIRQEVKDCGHGWHAVSCLAKLASKIVQQTISLPNDIMKVAQEAADLIENAEKEVKECANNSVNSVESEGKTLLAKISLCITTKIIHH